MLYNEIAFKMKTLCLAIVEIVQEQKGDKKSDGEWDVNFLKSMNTSTTETFNRIFWEIQSLLFPLLVNQHMLTDRAILHHLSA